MQFQAFDEATQFFVDVVNPVQPHQWDGLGQGVWTGRELVGHTSCALLTAIEYAERPAKKRDIDSSAEYDRVALGARASATR
jgi:hypothetical protein